MKRIKIISALLVLIICTSAFTLTSCSILEGTPRELTEGGLIINGGDTNNITIESSEGAGTLAASKALLSSVSIYSTFQVKQTSFFGTSYKDETHAGSGVIYKLNKDIGEAYVITNYHVIYDSTSTAENGISTSIYAYLYGQEFSNYAMKAEYIGGSMLYDIAILKISGSRTLLESSATAASVADSDEISVLESTVVIGNPAQLGISATTGSISVESETIEMSALDNQSSTTAMRVIRTDAAVNSGNSGGGLFNTKGELIGIVNAKIESSSIENIAYAIPSNIATRVADNIIAGYDGNTPATLKKCIIGITSVITEQKAVYDTTTGKINKIATVAVDSIEEGSLAQNILEVGDILVGAELGDKKITITKSHQLSELLLSARPGDILTVHIKRGEENKTVTITLTEECVTEYK